MAVMASAINDNTVWTSIFQPIPTFEFLRRYGRISPLTKKHDLPYHVVGSDLAGEVLRTGPGVNAWKPGDRVVAHCLSVELESPDGHDDTMLDPEQRIWGFETNFGGLAELALVKSNQLMPKPAHLTWEEGCLPRPGQLHRATAARLAPRGRDEAGRHRADLGRVGRVGFVRHPVRPERRGHPDLRRVVASQGRDLPRDGRRVDHRPECGGLPLLVRRAHPGPEGVEALRRADPRADRRGDDPDIVFEHPGRETFGASVYVARKGGTIVTCASTSGYEHTYDNRYLWMNLKRIVGSHFANYRESYEANRLIDKALIHPTLSKVYPLGETGQAGNGRPRQHPPRQGRGARARTPGTRGVRPGEARAAHRRDQPLPRRLSAHASQEWVAFTTERGRGCRSGPARYGEPMAGTPPFIPV